jgi:hyperosmotically inducible periplasmic protein
MNTKLAASCLVAGALMLPMAGYAADLKSAESSSETFVKDSVITTKIKGELAEEKLSSLLSVNVDTIDNGRVTLSGTVTSVANHIKIAADK